MHLETELMGTVRERAEDEAINVFARNLHDLLMAAPAGLRATMGLDPGLRTGVKVAVVDGTGKLVATDTIYPHTGQAAKAAVVVAALCEKYNVELVAIGNGTASRETERFYLDVQKQFPKVTAQKVIVSEAGASVYSASELAAQEFPGSGRFPARRGLYRPSFAGSAGGAGEDRPEIHRCGPVSARREPDAAGAQAGCGSGRLC